MKFVKSILLFVIWFYSVNLNAQRVFYDSINFDTCKISIKGNKEFCVCRDQVGKLSSEGYMKDGVRINHWKIYSLGMLLKEGNYKNGIKIGLWKEYYLSGSELFIGKYKRGKKNGKWKTYKSDFDFRRNIKNAPKRLTEIRYYNDDVAIKIEEIK